MLWAITLLAGRKWYNQAMSVLPIPTDSNPVPPLVPLSRGTQLLPATFVSRPNRFLIHATLHHETVAVHLADRGRLRNLLLPSARLLLLERSGAHRKTRYQAVAVYDDAQQRTLVSLNPMLANNLVRCSLLRRALPPLARYNYVQPEVRVGNHRIDFKLWYTGTTDEPGCLLEVKSSAQARDRIALFPDAPTTRGVNQVNMLAATAQRGLRAVLLFVVQRNDCDLLLLDETVDPRFATAVRWAIAHGVEVYAYRSALSYRGLQLEHAIPVIASRAILEHYR